MTNERRLSDDRIRMALSAGLPGRAPDQLAELVSRAVAATPQRRRPLLLQAGIPLDSRAVSLVGVVLLLLLAFIVLLAVGAFRPRAVVLTYHGDAARTGLMPGPGPVGLPRIEWQVTLGGPILGQPAVADGTVYVGDGLGEVEARLESSGGWLWTAHVPGAVIAPVGVSDGTVFVGDETGLLSAFDARTGSRRWAFSTKAAIRAGPLVTDGLLLVGSMDATLYALDPGTGTTRWSVALPGAVSRSIAVAGGVAYVPTDGGTLVAIDLASGTQRWSLKLGPGNLGTIVVSGDTVYVPTGIDVATAPRSLTALDLTTRATRWTFRTPANAMVFAGAVADGSVYGTSFEDHGLFAIDAATGTERWRLSTRGSNGGLAALVGTTIYLPSTDRSVCAIDTSTGELLWTQLLSGNPSALAVIDGRILLGTDLGLLISITGSPASGGSSGAASP